MHGSIFGKYWTEHSGHSFADSSLQYARVEPHFGQKFIFFVQVKSVFARAAV